MKKRNLKKWMIGLLSLALMFSNLPQVVHAQDTVHEAGDEASLRSALSEAEAGETITLTGSFSLSADICLEKDVVLDLNGQTVSLGSNSFQVRGTAEKAITVTIRDSGQEGKLTGTDYIIDMNAGGADTVRMESGILEGTGYTSVARIQSGDAFVMSGGVARQTQTNATWVLNVMNSGRAEVIGGRVEGTFGIKANAAASTIIVGERPIGDKQTPEEAERVYVSSVNASNAAAPVLLYSGTVGKLTGNVGEGFVLNCWFEQDVSDRLPAGMMCVEVDGHWEVERLTQENAAAMIGDTYYGSLVKAAAELQDGEVLVLLKDQEGTQNVKVTVDHAIIDLNGHSITNRASGGYGLEITSDAGLPQGTTGVTVRNSSGEPSRITADIPLYARSGNSMKELPIVLDETIELVSNSGNTCIELGTSAYVEHTERTAAYITEGGFLSTHADGKQYIHGSFTQAAQSDVTKTAVLLNDLQGGISVSAEHSDLTLDLNGHTVTSNGTAVIRVNTSDARLTIKNGTMVNTDGTGAEVGIPAGGAPGGNLTYYHRVTLCLENVDLTSTNDFGIVTNGVSTDIHIQLTGGSITADNGIGIYFPPADSTLTIDGTRISGTTGTAIKGGTVHISGNAVIIGTGEAQEPSEGADSGVHDTGAAVYVEGNYDRDVQVNIDSGTFTSRQGHAVQMLEDAEATGEKNIVIKGGTYSDEEAAEYIYPGLSIVENADGTYSIARKASVYVDGVAGDDSRSGDSSETAVRTLEHALNLVDEEGTIYICGTVTIDSAQTLEGVTIERAEGYGGQLLAVSGPDAVLTLIDTTIDGKALEAQMTGYLVFVSNGATLNIMEGSQLLNNQTTAVYVNVNSDLNMSGGAISGNIINNPQEDGYLWGGAGIVNNGTCIVSGGEISNNHTYGYVAGGIRHSRGTFVLEGDASVTKNSADWYGGGIVVEAGAQLLLDGASITENEAGYYGGGVYIFGATNADQKTTSFEMRSGSIMGNQAVITGGGIFAQCANDEVIVSIRNGAIKDNVSAEEDMGHAIALYGENGSDLYPRLELSGQPEINGDVFFQNDYEDGYVIQVVDAFQPVVPIQINRSNDVMDIPAVTYAQGLTPDREDFVSRSLFEGLVVSGQDLKWATASVVYFYEEGGESEYRDHRHSVIIGETIDAANVPHPTKNGYTLSGWKLRGSDQLWDMESDEVSERFTRLEAVWTLDRPTVDVSADHSTFHEGHSVLLSASPSHAAAVTYTYQWYRDGMLLEGETSETLQVFAAGDYTVLVRASDGTKVSETLSDPLTLVMEAHTYVPSVTEPTCTEKGYTTYLCTVCNDSYQADFVDALGHAYADTWSSDAHGHWIECTRCHEKSEVHAHTYQWIIDKEATTEAEGLRHERCMVCGHETEAVVIPKLEKTDEGGTDTAAGHPSMVWAGLAVLSMLGIADLHRRKRRR